MSFVFLFFQKMALKNRYSIPFFGGLVPLKHPSFFLSYTRVKNHQNFGLSLSLSSPGITTLSVLPSPYSRANFLTVSRRSCLPFSKDSFTLAFRKTSAKEYGKKDKGLVRKQNNRGILSSLDVSAKRKPLLRTHLQAYPKQEVVSITYEEIGLFPRSFSRVLDRFLKQVFSDVDNLVIQEYRFYRYLFLTTLKCLFIFFFVPFFVNFLAKNYVIRPFTEYYWNTKQTEIFLNSSQQKHAFSELKEYEEKFYFESLIYPKSLNKPILEHRTTPQLLPRESQSRGLAKGNSDPLFSQNNNRNNGDSVKSFKTKRIVSLKPFLSRLKTRQAFRKQKTKRVWCKKGPQKSLRLVFRNLRTSYYSQSRYVSPMGKQNLDENTSLMTSNLSQKSVFVFQTLESDKNRQHHYQEKTKELAQRYNDQSVEAITNGLGDIVSLGTLFYLLYVLEIQVNITQSFLVEVFFGLDDSQKSLLILLVTDLLVGYHSSNLWEFFFEFFFNHYGLPESQTGIFLLVATLPVLLDVLFKYFIFRHLNRSSPATVATYHAIIE